MQLLHIIIYINRAVKVSSALTRIARFNRDCALPVANRLMTCQARQLMVVFKSDKPVACRLNMIGFYLLVQSITFNRLVSN